ncbi:hypothetical protein IT418_01445, partial [bacterium]|nr:hypothetical protein [bacterium]
LISAGFFYADALETAKKIQAQKADITRLKNKLVQSNKKALEGGDKYYKEYTHEHKFTQHDIELINKLLNEFLSIKKTPTILKIIGVHPAFHMRYQKIKENAEKHVPISYQLVSLSKVSPQGHTIKGGADGTLSWIMEMYDLHLQVLMNSYLGRLFQNLISTKKLTRRNVTSYFKKSNLFAAENMVLLETAIERFFAKDYVSFLHIAVPQFENIFLKISAGLGLDVVALEPTSEVYTRTKVLSSELILSEKFIETWNEDYCRLIDFLLFEPLGYKLRHKIAHGEIYPGECNFRNAIHVMYLYLALIAAIVPVQSTPVPAQPTVE